MLSTLLILPVISTLTGGLLAVRFRRYLSLLIAAATGLLLGAAFLDLLPEALVLGAKQGMDAGWVLGLTLVFFLVFGAVESGLDAVSAAEQKAGSRKIRRWLAGGMMVFHSFRDGMAIGAAFTASHAAGYAVALGIVAHDLGDGMNTILLTTQGERAGWTDYLLLGADALAPFFGGLLTSWWLLSSRDAVILLTLAAGFFLQMATSDFLPQLRRLDGQRRWMLSAVFGGAGVIFLANWLLRE